MIHIIEDYDTSNLRYFAVNTIDRTGTGFYSYTPECALSNFINQKSQIKDHSTANDVVNGTLNSFRRIHSSYSPEEYPEYFI